MEQTFNHRIKRLSDYKILPKKNKIDINDTSEKYPHVTFNVSTLSEYFTIIKILSSIIKDDYYDGVLIYRGMENSCWELTPSISRLKKYNQNTEHLMINEFLTLRPEAFQGLSSNYDLLAKMQHYGLPTRLLDFSTNPLVALYFACESCSKTDARVVCHNSNISHSDKEVINNICGISINDTIDSAYPIEHFLDSKSVSLYEYLKRLYCHSNTLVAKPKYYNQRIINQSAMFIVFPNKLRDRFARIAYNKESESMNTEEERRIILEIDESLRSIYPTSNFNLTCNSVKKLFSYYSPKKIFTKLGDMFDFNSEYGKLFLNRFLIDEELEKIDLDIARASFCSIIINKKNKQLILRELSSIGIDRAFVYPELEYTAQKIMLRYK